MSTSIIHLGKRDAVTVDMTNFYKHKAYLSFPVFIILSILTFPYSFNPIVAQVRTLSMGFGTPVYEFLYQGVLKISLFCLLTILLTLTPARGQAKGLWPCYQSLT